MHGTWMDMKKIKQKHIALSSFQSTLFVPCDMYTF